MARILIVEDNSDLVRILEEVLSEEHEVRTALRGDEGLERARDFQPDVVILDLHLPVISGIEVGRQIKRESRPRRVPILALTARAHTEEEIMRSGCCDAFLAKPAPLHRIRGRVEALLRSGEEAPE